MKMLQLKALKPHKYGTRHLTAGEEYEAPVRQAVALMATKKAKVIKTEKRPAAKPEPPQAEPAAATPATEHETTNHVIDRLRLEATQLGINVDGRWGVARLQHEIAQARR